MKSFVLMLGLVLAGCSALNAGGYIEAQGGLSKESYGLRGGRTWSGLDLSLGYFKDTDHDIDFHTVGGQAAYLWSFGAIKAGPSLGVGYTMLNFANGISKTADNGVNFTAGIRAEYSLAANWVLGLSLNRFIFNADTHETTYSSHNETLSNGQGVEVLDVSHQDDSENFNSWQPAVSLKYRF